VKKHHDYQVALSSSIEAYKQSLVLFRDSERQRLARMAELDDPSVVRRFEQYLDYQQSTGHSIKSSYGLPVSPPNDLMNWGEAINVELDLLRANRETQAQAVFESLCHALYTLGQASLDWVSPCQDLSNRSELFTSALKAAGDYRQKYIDGKRVITQDGPFINGLAKRLGVAPSELLRSAETKVSVFEQAYWAVVNRENLELDLAPSY